jgi:hypothetical protein
LGKNINQAINAMFKGPAFNSLNALTASEFFTNLEGIFTAGESGLKDFAFLIFDTNNDGFISEMDL